MTENSPHPAEREDSELSEPELSEPDSTTLESSSGVDSELEETAVTASRPSARRGLRWWGWVLLAAIPLFALHVFVAVFISNTVVDLAGQAIICYADGFCGPQSKAQATSAPTDGAFDGAEPTNRIALDRHAVFDGQPAWSIQLKPNWEVMVFDKDGVNIFRNSETGCQLITAQSLAAPDSAALNDSDPSQALLDYQIRFFSTDHDRDLVVDSSTIDVPIGLDDGGPTLEFATAAISRVSPTGEQEVVEIAARSMPDSESDLFAVLICETDVDESFDSDYEVFSKLLAVRTTP